MHSVVFATGHRRDGESTLDWAALARPHQTAVIYMGVGQLATHCAALVGHDVLIPSTKWSLEAEGATNGMVAAPGVGFVNVDITDAKGNKVRISRRTGDEV